MKDKYLWYTDTHLDRVTPWKLFSFIRSIVREKPDGVFLTGDISNGLLLCHHLKLMAYFIKCPIYFVLGNHDYHFSNFDKQHNKLRELCKTYTNLVWLTDSDIIALNDEVALIGVEGWYDARLGNPKYLKFTLDWVLIEDFKKLSTMGQRIEAFQKLSQLSNEILSRKIKLAFDKGYKEIYILTHFPPWKEATRDEGTILEALYLSYNVNLSLGSTIELAVENNKNVEIFCGHSHHPEYIHVSRNIRCQVGAVALKRHIIYA
jgi:predicted phosphohydrolase